MAFAGAYYDVFDIPAATPAARYDEDALIELEFSDYGRDDRFLPGWYILPSVLGGLLVIASLLI